MNINTQTAPSIHPAHVCAGVWRPSIRRAVPTMPPSRITAESHAMAWTVARRVTVNQSIMPAIPPMAMVWALIFHRNVTATAVIVDAAAP